MDTQNGWFGKRWLRPINLFILGIYVNFLGGMAWEKLVMLKGASNYDRAGGTQLTLWKIHGWKM